MIKTAHSKKDIVLALSVDFIADKQPLQDYAGFEQNSKYAGQIRQTFSLVVSSETINNIYKAITPLYNHLLAVCWPEQAVLPFDMVRFDAFLDPANDSLKIIELNTRNVGLHEIVEWLDEETALQLSTQPTWSLNINFVLNQKLLHNSHFGDTAPLLYMTKPMIPNWKYYDELVANYSSVCHITNPDDYEITPKGVQVNQTIYNAVTRKFSWPTSAQLEKLNTNGTICIMQPLWMRQFGQKDYLPNFDNISILQSEPFSPANINRYIANRQSLVLKIIDSGGSKSVYLGPLCTDKQWKQYLLIASSNPKKWSIQQYLAPHKHDVIVHGKQQKNVPIQLGIFVLPNPSSPREFSLDIVVKAYGGNLPHFTFDPSGLNPDIWFGNVIENNS